MISWTPPNPGDARDVSVFNSTMAALAAQSTAHPADAWRMEGLDGRSIHRAACPQQAFNPVEIAGSAILNNAVWAVPVVAAANVQSGAFTVGVNETIKVVASVDVPTEIVGPQPGVDPGNLLEARLILFRGGAVTVLATTRRALRRNVGYEGSFFLMVELDDDGGFRGAWDYVAIQTQITGGGLYRIARPQIYGFLYPRST